MKISDLNPHIRYAKIHYMHTNTSSEFSVCYDCRFFHIEKGSGAVIIDKNKYNISSGDTLYLPPATRYRFDFTDSNSLKIIVLDFDLINSFNHIKSSVGTSFEKDFLPERVISYDMPSPLSQPIIRKTPHIGHSLVRCTENFLTREAFYREKSSALLKLCILEIMSDANRNTEYTNLSNDVTKYIYENYMHHTLSNTDIAEKFNYHPYHLNRIFKQETGKSLHRYLIEYRIRIAKNYLLTTQYSIEQISWKSGFSSTAYFIKMFRGHTGITPKKYRQLHFHTEI